MTKCILKNLSFRFKASVHYTPLIISTFSARFQDYQNVFCTLNKVNSLEDKTLISILMQASSKFDNRSTKLNQIWFRFTCCILWLFLKQLFTSKSLIVGHSFWCNKMHTAQANWKKPGTPKFLYKIYNFMFRIIHHKLN